MTATSNATGDTIDRSRRQARRFRRVAFVFGLIGPLFARVDIDDLSGKPEPGTAVVFVANHRSFFDIPVDFEFFANLGFAPQVAVHRRFFRNRVLAGVLRYFGAVPVGSGDADRWLAGATAELAAGRSVALMPEGEITAPGEHLGRLRTGVVRLAEVSGAVVVPIGTSGTAVVWPLGRPLPKIRLRRPTIRARVETPMSFADFHRGTFVDALAATLAELIGPETSLRT